MYTYFRNIWKSYLISNLSFAAQFITCRSWDWVTEVTVSALGGRASFVFSICQGGRTTSVLAIVSSAKLLAPSRFLTFCLEATGGLLLVELSKRTWSGRMLHVCLLQTANYGVFLQVLSSQKKQRDQTIEFSWGLYCLVVLSLLLYVIHASVPEKEPNYGRTWKH